MEGGAEDDGNDDQYDIHDIKKKTNYKYAGIFHERKKCVRE